MRVFFVWIYIVLKMCIMFLTFFIYLKLYHTSVFFEMTKTVKNLELCILKEVSNNVWLYPFCTFNV